MKIDIAARKGFANVNIDKSFRPVQLRFLDAIDKTIVTIHMDIETFSTLLGNIEENVDLEKLKEGIRNE